MDALRVAVQQPQFLPWDGYWHRAAESDLFILYGGVQYADRNYSNRVMVAGSWMTLPVIAAYQATYDEVMVNPHDVHGLVRRIEQTYMTKKCPFGYRLIPLCELLESWDSWSLLDLLAETHMELQKFLRHQPIVRIDHVRRTGDFVEKMKSCLDEFVGPSAGQVTMLSSEKMRGWYDSLVDGVQYQQIPQKNRDESFMARIVTEQIPDEWPAWGWRA